MTRRTLTAGKIETIWWNSVHLTGNLLNEADKRRVDVYVPHENSDAASPLLIFLPSFSSSGPIETTWRPFGESLAERVDRLITEGKMPAAVIAFPDTLTSLGGVQYVDTPILGYWESAICDDLVLVLEDRFACGGANRRGVFGHSSGGYGALRMALRHRDLFTAVAAHAPDCAFHISIQRFLPKIATMLQRFDGDPKTALKEITKLAKLDKNSFEFLMITMLSASFDPSIQSGEFEIQLPIDLKTGELIEERWARWKANDLIILADEQGDAIKNVKALYLDAGADDEFGAHFGVRQLQSILTKYNSQVHVEEFRGGHHGNDHRYNISLPLLINALI